MVNLFEISQDLIQIQCPPRDVVLGAPGILHIQIKKAVKEPHLRLALTKKAQQIYVPTR